MHTFTSISQRYLGYKRNCLEDRKFIIKILLHQAQVVDTQVFGINNFPSE